MNILFTICGRAGSKGIKNKNVKEFFGFPLPFYALSAVDSFTKQTSNLKFDVVLNTDSQDLINLFQHHINYEVNIIQRDSRLGKDHVPKIEVISDSLSVMKKRKSIRYDMVVDIDISSPLRTIEDMSNLISTKTKSNADVVFSVTQSRRNPYFNMVIKTNKGYDRVIKSTYNARQEAPETFDINGSLYAYSPNFLETGKDLFQGRCEVITMKDTAVLDLDHENDYELMLIIAKYLYANYPSYRYIRDNIQSFLKS